jgi:hypothetical protein
LRGNQPQSSSRFSLHPGNQCFLLFIFIPVMGSCPSRYVQFYAILHCSEGIKLHNFHHVLFDKEVACKKTLSIWLFFWAATATKELSTSDFTSTCLFQRLSIVWILKMSRNTKWPFLTF